MTNLTHDILYVKSYEAFTAEQFTIFISCERQQKSTFWLLSWKLIFLFQKFQSIELKKRKVRKLYRNRKLTWNHSAVRIWFWNKPFVLLYEQMYPVSRTEVEKIISNALSQFVFSETYRSIALQSPRYATIYANKVWKN